MCNGRTLPSTLARCSQTGRDLTSKNSFGQGSSTNPRTVACGFIIGRVHDFLTSRWLHELQGAGLPLDKIRELFLRDDSGETAIPGRLGPVLAWLCLWDTEIRAEMIKEAPALLIAHGDPSGFSEEERVEILRSYATCYRNRTRLFNDFEHASLERFATPALADAVKELLAQQELSEELASLLFELVKLGRIQACLAEAIRVALRVGAPNRARIAAIRAVAALGGDEDRARLLVLVDQTQTWPQDVAGAFVGALYPDVLRVDGVVRVLERCESKRKNFTTLLQGTLEYDIPKRGSPEFRQELLGSLLDLVRGWKERAEPYRLPRIENGCSGPWATWSARSWMIFQRERITRRSSGACLSSFAGAMSEACGHGTG